MKKNIQVGLLVLTLFCCACSHNVPLRNSLELSNPPNPKLDKKILVVMPDDQSQLVIRHKPDPLADTYVFAGGPALKNLLLNVLGQVFSEVTFANSREGVSQVYDYAVGVNLNSYKIILNIYKGNEVKLGVDYTVFDSKGKEVKKIPTNVSSKDRYSGGELVATFLVGAFYNIGKMKESSGAAWDQAAINSISEMLDNLIIIAQKN